MGVDVAVFHDFVDADRLTRDLQRKIKETQDGSSKYRTILSSIVFSDILSHFREESGEEGPWVPWSKIYQEHMEKIGKGGNKILQDTGKLRNSITPGQARDPKVTGEGYLFFSPISYSGVHDRGTKKMPKRDFMWLSDVAMDRMAEQTLKFILDENA